MKYSTLVFIICWNVAIAGDINLGKIIINATQDEIIETSVSTTIKKESFDAKTQTVAEAIKKETGVQIRQSGGLGSFSSLSLRGASSNQVMIFIDGVSLNDGSGSAVDLSSVSVSDIDSIEIYKDVTPVAFGKASIGGAVNIKTRRPEKKLNASIKTGRGSFGSFYFSPFISHKYKNLDYVFSYEFTKSKNDFEFLNNNGTKWNSLDDKIEKRNNNQFFQNSLFTSMGWSFTEYTKLIFNNNFYKKEQNLPSWNNNPLTDTNFNTNRNISSIKLTLDDLGDLHINSSTMLDYVFKKEIYNDQNSYIGIGKQYNEYKTYNYGLNQFVEILINNWNIINAVFDFHNEEHKTYDLSLNNLEAYNKRNVFTYSMDDKMILLDDKIIVNPAIIIEHYNSNYTLSNNYFNPRIGFKYRFIKPVTFKTNLARYTREPSFFELFGDKGFFTGNENLKKEQGLNFDLGIESNLSDKIKIDFAYYRNAVDDVISYVYNARGIGQALNISRSTITGIEAGIDFTFLNHVNINSKYTKQIALNKSQIASYNNKKIPGRFENVFSNRLEFCAGIFKLYYDFTYSDGLFYDSPNLLRAEIKREHDLGFTVLPYNFKIDFEIKNIGNVNFQDFNGYPQPGRSFWLNVKYELS